MLSSRSAAAKWLRDGVRLIGHSFLRPIPLTLQHSHSRSFDVLYLLVIHRGAIPLIGIARWASAEYCIEYLSTPQRYLLLDLRAPILVNAERRPQVFPQVPAQILLGRLIQRPSHQRPGQRLLQPAIRPRTHCDLAVCFQGDNQSVGHPGTSYSLRMLRQAYSERASTEAWTFGQDPIPDCDPDDYRPNSALAFTSTPVTAPVRARSELQTDRERDRAGGGSVTVRARSDLDRDCSADAGCRARPVLDYRGGRACCPRASVAGRARPVS
jgi:hypothetical protein